MKKSTFFAIIATLMMLIILMTFIVAVKLSVRLDQLKEAEIQTPDLTDLSDGVYTGEYEIFPLSVKVDVTVTNHQFADIVVTESSLFFDTKAEAVIATIVQTQSLVVDISEDNEYSERILLLAIIDAIDPVEVPVSAT